MNPYLVLVDHDETGYGAMVPELETVMANAETLEELLALVSEGIALHLLDSSTVLEPQWRTLTDVPAELLEGFGSNLQAHLVVPAPINPVSLEIARALERHHLNQSELARRLGTSRASVSRLMDPFYWGHSFPTLRRVAEALGEAVHFELRVA